MIMINSWILFLFLWNSPSDSEAFAFQSPTMGGIIRSTLMDKTTETQLFMGMSRKARRQLQQEQKTKVGRDKKFRDALNDDDDDDDDDESNKNNNNQENNVQDEINRRMDQRPSVSNLYVDQETGMEIIQQGRYVMDVITRKAVQLYPDPNLRLAQMFPGCPPEIRDQYRLDWSNEAAQVPDILQRLVEACSCKTTGDIPAAPSITNRGIDFVLANRDRLGHPLSKTLGRLMMRAAWQDDKVAMRQQRNVLRNYLTIENYISAPFRQIIMDSELAIGPNFGNLDLKKFIGMDLYERSAAYIVLKGMQCTWEKKVRDADFLENTPPTPDNYYLILGTGDPRRYHPEPDVIWELKESSRVCAMCIEMVKAFVNDESMFQDLPVELRFLESALSIQGGEALRKFVADDFCPKEEITPEALREGMRRLLVQLDSMYLDPYADIRNVVDKLQRAISVGTSDAYDPYQPYLESLTVDSPGYFQTYTFNHNPMSLVRFLDAKKFEPAPSSEPTEIENPFASVSLSITNSLYA
jgi:hypothetical protein